VLDLYSLNEAGPVAVFDERAGGHVVLQHRLFVELLDPVAGRGEVTLTGGFNFCLPLVRYRTGDWAELRHVRGEVVLVGLEGRPPVTFDTASGERINNIEVTHALRPFLIRQFALHQRADRSLWLRLDADAGELGAIRAALLELFGPSQALDVEPVTSLPDKIVQYTREA
jgi:phenylacetate-CoA ligase